MSIAWIFLLCAGLLEVSWAFFLKKSQGFTNIPHTSLFVLSLALSMALLGLSLRQIPLSTAYPIWTGIGAVGSIAVGGLFFFEPLGATKLFFSACIVFGIVGLKLTT